MNSHDQNKKRIFFFLSFLLFSTILLGAQTNPFFSSPDPGNLNTDPLDGNSATADLPQIDQDAVYAVSEEAGFLETVIKPIIRYFSDSMTQAAAEIKSGENPWALWIFLGVSFIYGIFHALGPGHGKILMSTYIATHQVNKRALVGMGTLIGLIHAGTTGILVLLVAFLIQGVLSVAINEATGVLQTVSALLIAIMGIYMVVSGILHDRSHKKLREKQDSQKALEKDGETRGEKKLGYWGVILSVGLVPCTGTAALLVLSIGLDIILAGLLGMVFLSLGMASTLVAIALGVFIARKGLTQVAAKTRIGIDWHLVSHFISGSALFIIAVLMLSGFLLG